MKKSIALHSEDGIKKCPIFSLETRLVSEENIGHSV